MKSNIKSGIRLPHLLAIAAISIAPLAISADDSETSSKSKSASSSATDKGSVLQNAAKVNLATIKFSELAQQKAQSPELKQYAQQVAQDHKKAQQDLERIAQKHNVTLATSVDEKCQEAISKLEALNGAEFDKEYARGSIEGHAMAVAHLQQASAGAQDTDIRQYTQQLLAKVKEHQRKARTMAMSVGLDQSTITSIESKAQSGVGGAASSATGSSDSSSSSDPSSSKKADSTSPDQSSNPTQPEK